MTQADARERASVDVLAEVANDLAGEFRLQPLLGRILRSAVELLGCRSGSLCLIDQVSHTYRKAGWPRSLSESRTRTRPPATERIRCPRSPSPNRPPRGP